MDDGASAASHPRPKRGLHVYGATQVVAKVFGLLLLVLVAAGSHPSQLGLFTFGVIGSALLAFLFEFGTTSTVVRTVRERPGHLDDSLLHYLYGRAVPLWAAGISLEVLAFVGVRNQYAGLVLLAFGIGAIMAANSIATGFLLALSRGWTSGLPNVAYNVLGCLVAIAIREVSGTHANGLELLLTYGVGSTAAGLLDLVFMCRAAGRSPFSLTNFRLRVPSPDRELSIRRRRRATDLECR